MYETGFEFPGETFEFPAESAFEFPAESGTFEFGPWESGESGTGYEGEGEAESLEAEFASRLLEVSTEAEMDRFLGDLAKSVVKGASSFIKSPIGKALGGVLKNVAKTALPAVGGALGSLVLPGAGTAIGAKLGSLAGGLLEAGEAETMGEAEAQYEAAQRYVRFARSAYGLAASAPRNIPPRSVARAASISAARQHAPSLLRNDQRMSPWRQRRRPPYGWPPPPWGYYPQPWYAADYSGGYGDGPDDGGPWSDSDTEAGPGVGLGGRGQGQGGPGGQRGPGGQGGPGGQRAMEGRWIRRGHRIVLFGV